MKVDWVSVAEKQIDVGPAEFSALEEAFDLFSRQTVQLRDAYLQLQKQAEQMNLELEAANLELQAKVRQLDEANNFQRSILESIPVAVVVTDLDGIVNTHNPAAEATWGVPRDRALGRHFRDIMGSQSDLLAGVFSGKYRRETLRRELGEDGERIISSTACLVEDSAGRPIGAVQVDRDITRVCALESQVHHQEKLADLGKMAAGLAHEIRKPLNGIKGFASLLERGADEGQPEHRYVSCIMAAADRLNEMLGRLLDFARPDAVRLAACDLRSAAEEVADFLRAEDPDSPVSVRVDVPEDLPAALADGNKIKQVLLNLAKNGVEAHDREGCVTITARVEERDGAPCVRVAVTDTGRGIPRDKLAKVVEPFYTDRQGGTGLGLAIVHRILQLHGTPLSIESSAGVGTQAEFVLPVATG
jgi:PAS domain S-box-containing protein